MTASDQPTPVRIKAKRNKKKRKERGKEGRKRGKKNVYWGRKKRDRGRQPCGSGIKE